MRSSSVELSTSSVGAYFRGGILEETSRVSCVSRVSRVNGGERHGMFLPIAPVWQAFRNTARQGERDIEKEESGYELLGYWGWLSARCVVGRVLYFLYVLQETQLQMMHSLFNDPLQLFHERFPRLISILCIFP